MPVDVVLKASEDVAVGPVVLVYLRQIVPDIADKVCEQHQVVDEHSIVEEAANKHFQVLPVVEGVSLLLQVAPQQLMKLVCFDRLHGFIEETHGLLIGTVKDPGASVQIRLVGVWIFLSTLSRFPGDAAALELEGILKLV